MQNYTIESLKMQNDTELTAVFAEAVRDYLKETTGIVRLSLTVDGKGFVVEDEEDGLQVGTARYDACDKLTQAKEVRFEMRSFGETSLDDRLEGYLAILANNVELKDLVTYKCVEYSDEDERVFLCTFDENGLRFPHESFANTIDDVMDIERWYCNTPNVSISFDEDVDDDTCALLRDCFARLAALGGRDADEAVTDDLEEYGEIAIDGSLEIDKKDIKELESVLREMRGIFLSNGDAEWEIAVYAVPDGDGDYAYAALAITADETDFSLRAARI